jgi:hypothetical protein
MKKESLLRALVVSLILGAVFPAVYVALFVKGVEYDPPVDFSTFSQLPYEEQTKTLEKSARTVSGPQVLINRSTEPRFWLEYGELMLMGFMFAFAASVSVLAWERRSRSNPRFEADAP